MLSEREEEKLEDFAISLITAIRSLGNGNACTELGGMEALGVEIKNGCEEIASGLNAIATAINESRTTPKS